MNPKLTATKVLNYIRTTKKKPNFRHQTGSCPIATYLKDCGYRDIYVDTECISYKNSFGERAEIFPPKWARQFVEVYDLSKRAHALRNATKVLEEVVTKNVNRKMTTKTFGNKRKQV